MKSLIHNSLEGRKLEARYANYFAVGSNALELLLDFGQSYEDDESAIIHTRIITSPGYAMAILETLQNAISQHESRYGVIIGQDKKDYS